MIISSGTKKGQKTFTFLFLGILAVLLFMAAVSKNLNYLTIILFAMIFFSPVYLYTLNFYDVYVERDFIKVSNLFSTKRVEKNLFVKVVPAKKVLITFNSPYFTILFKDNKKYNFILKRPIVEVFSRNRTMIAEELTKDVNSVIQTNEVRNT